MAAGSETSSENFQEYLNFSVKDNNHVDKGDQIRGVHQSPKTEIEDYDDDGIPVPEVQLYPPEQVCLEWTEVHKIGAGLENLGNTCYLNAVIQCLTYCPPLANYLLQGDHNVNCTKFKFCMMCELQKHTREVFQRPGHVIKPLCIYRNLKHISEDFQFGQQEDAHEFLRFLIDNLWRSSIHNHSDCDRLDPASQETTIINHIFGGYSRNQVVCLQCNQTSDRYEHFMDLILDIQNADSLEEAIEQFVKPEFLENENAYKCSKCDTFVTAEKTVTIHRPPNVATFQLKRFHYYPSYGKITKPISYPESFDLRPYMSRTKGGSLLYQLNAVLVHEGRNCNSGHYYCYVRNSNGHWYLMDDAEIKEVSLHDVLRQQAYILFYVRSTHNDTHFEHLHEPEKIRKLFVGDLHFRSTEKSLKSHFEQWGEIVRCNLRKDPHTKRSKRFGYITYKRAYIVDDAQAARPRYIDGRTVVSMRAIPKEESGNPNAQITVNKLIVRELKEDIEEGDLREYFRKYGKIISVNIATDKSTGKKRGFAFIEFDDHDPVDKIVLLKIHYLKGKMIQVQKAWLKEVRDSNRRDASYHRSQGRTNGCEVDYASPNFFSDGFGNCIERPLPNGAGYVVSTWYNADGSSYGGGPVRIRE